ncbi:helix-turn-helix transcriptional regulator [Leucobacter sp. NPDC058333]|uniref:helix-turn-helix transcriptional regulator n=1 Tax=Leucobacter sp. NPDC058333 TaxID=3346450 RepID=UPI00364F910E
MTAVKVLEVERQYSVRSAADLLGVSTQYIYDRMDDGELPRRLDLGGGKAKYRIPASDLQRFIDSRTSNSKKPKVAASGQNN